jgi:branched-chain amino acid transport system ATP-binding protein
MLTIEKISASYGQIRILHDISMEVLKGETAVLVGPNGAGKTTLLKVISGALRPNSGMILFDNQRIDGKASHEVAEMGISLVPEGGRIFPEFTVFENLRVGSYCQRARNRLRENIDEVFGLFPILENRRSQVAGSLSGGERQMLAIARSLMSQPKLIMFDEPSSGLAPKIVVDVFEFIKKIKERGYSILLVEQNVKKSIQLTDHTHLIESGRLQFVGSREDFIRNPQIKKAYLGI